MKQAERQTRSYLMALFAKHGFHPRTDLGQNFLIDLNLIDYIAREAQIHSNDVVLEVGAGTGGLTTALAQQAAAVISVEIDPRVAAIAGEMVARYQNVSLLNCDVLKNKNHFAPQVLDALQSALDKEPGRRLKLIANLPYNVATPVVSNLVATEFPWSRMVVTIQWELALRMVAMPGTSQYGALSVWLQSQCCVSILKKLAPTVFWPRPGVDSGVVCLIPDTENRARISDRRFFMDFVRRLFHHRRKLLRRVLVGMYSKQLSKPDIDTVLASMDLVETTRAENLAPPTFVELSNRLHALFEERNAGTEADTSSSTTR